MDELEEILDWMKSKEGLPVTNIKERMSVAVVNSLWTVVSGKRYKHDDPAILKLTKDLTE